MTEGMPSRPKMAFFDHEKSLADETFEPTELVAAKLDVHFWSSNV
jgi:hypothetical protein